VVADPRSALNPFNWPSCLLASTAGARHATCCARSCACSLPDEMPWLTVTAISVSMVTGDGQV